MAPIVQHYSQDVCGIGSGPFSAPGWPECRFGIDWVELKCHHPIASTSILFWHPIPPILSFYLVYPPQTVDISWLLPWMGGAALQSFLPTADHPSWSNHPRRIVVVNDVIIVIVIVSAAAVGCPLHHCHCHRRPVLLLFSLWHGRRRHALLLLLSPLPSSPSSSTSLRRRCRHTFSAPWRPIRGIWPKHAKVVSPMAWGWSACPWIGPTEAKGVARMTSCPWCRPDGNIMVLERWRLERSYRTVDSIYSYLKLRERILRNCAGTFL